MQKFTGLLLAVLIVLTCNGLAAEKTVKVFLLAGQSNMEGYGGITTIDELGGHPESSNLLKKIKRGNGSFIVRDDVFVYFKRSNDTVKAPLTVGQGVGSDRIGPELLFGITMGDHYKEPVLLIKTAWGGKDLYCDFRPPSAGKPAYKINPKDGKERKPGVFYHRMVKEIKDCLMDINTNFPKLKKLKPEIVGFVWFQGFNEMFAGKDVQTQVYAEYAGNYAHMIADLKKELELDKLPSIVGAVGTPGVHKNEHPLHIAQAAVMQQKSLKGEIGFVDTEHFLDPELAQLQGQMKQLAQAEMKKLDAQYKLSGEKSKDGKPRHADWETGYKLARATNAYKELDARFKKKGSHWPCHYYGSARTYCLIGHALAEGMKELTETPPTQISRNPKGR